MLVKNLMVLGKLFLILACSTSHAQSWTKRTIWYVGLDKADIAVHSRTAHFALSNLETDAVAEWFNDKDVSQGKVKIIATWTGSGNVCRRMYSYVITRKNTFTYEDTACYNNNTNTWNFVDK